MIAGGILLVVSLLSFSSSGFAAELAPSRTPQTSQTSVSGVPCVAPRIVFAADKLSLLSKYVRGGGLVIRNPALRNIIQRDSTVALILECRLERGAYVRSGSFVTRDTPFPQPYSVSLVDFNALEQWGQEQH